MAFFDNAGGIDDLRRSYQRRTESMSDIHSLRTLSRNRMSFLDVPLDTALPVLTALPTVSALPSAPTRFSSRRSKRLSPQQRLLAAIAPSATDTARSSLEKDTGLSTSAGDIELESTDGSHGDLGDPLDDLPEHEAAILRRQIEVRDVPVAYKTLFRYATRADTAIMVLGAVSAIAAGAILPCMTVIFGSLSNVFRDFFLGVINRDGFHSALNKYTLYFVYLGIGEYVAIYLATVTFAYTGDHMTRKIREDYLRSLLRQNVGYYDKLGAGEVVTRITSDTVLIQEGLSGRIPLTLTALATFFTAFIIGFIKYWKLTLILTSTVIAIAIVMGLGSSWIVKWTKLSLDSYALGGTVAEETLSAIRNSVAFSTQDKLARQYNTHLVAAERYGVRYKSLLGFCLGCMMGIVYLTYGLAFWQGSRYLVAGEMDLSKVLTILLALMIGAFALGNVAPHAQAFGTAAAAGAKIFNTIDRASPIDAQSDVGRVLDRVRGDIELRHVRHIYPSRPEVVVMHDVSLRVPAGRTTALVGASGSGKSTIVGLVERFYDPVGGEVFLDGVNIQELNVRFLRQQISLVSQEPTLFSTSIFGNIAHGLIGTPYENIGYEKKFAMVCEAAKMANAHDFVSALPEGYETAVGQRGFLLSGGQKQRIAIARAVVSNPSILLLDEATSALDTKSEGVVQNALDKAAQGRTTIVIAHRLSTIKNADNIVVMQEGRIVEQGRHAQLLDRRGAYYNLVKAQSIQAHVQGDLALREEDEHPEKMYVSRQGAPIFRATPATLFETKPAPPMQYKLWPLIKMVGAFNRQEWLLMLHGLFWSIIAGGGQPVQSVLFAKCIVALIRPPILYDQLRADINYWCKWFILLAFAQIVAFTGNGVSFAICSERLIRRVRDTAFRAMLRQDISYFDKEENTAGALTAFLSTESNRVAGLSGQILGTLLTVLTTLVASFALSLAIGWKLALVCIATVPVVLACGFGRLYMLQKWERETKTVYEKSSGYACEATSAIRTVASLTREADVWANYNAQLKEQSGDSIKATAYSANLYAASQSLMFLCIALGFWYGGRLLGDFTYTLEQFYIVFVATIFGAQSAGTVFSFAPDIGKARAAAERLKELYDRRPEIDSWSTDGKVLDQVRGLLKFENVRFRYPNRPQQPILRGLNFEVRPGQFVALVGPSGCGKSTTIALLERFYNPTSGRITLDGNPIDSLNLKGYRSHIALVSQEPTLYQGTIRENILLGADHADSVGDREIEQACADANILSFITSLPDGFNTPVGGKGVMLSGGQKQRVAIARALLRNPRVLLLDEATSALDSESEKIVQEALDRASKGRTTVAVAHRLASIQHADCIYVFEGGLIVEAGTHGELMRRGGRYRELVSLQSLSGA